MRTRVLTTGCVFTGRPRSTYACSSKERVHRAALPEPLAIETAPYGLQAVALEDDLEGSFFSAEALLLLQPVIATTFRGGNLLVGIIKYKIIESERVRAACNLYTIR